MTLQNAPFNYRNDPWLPADATDANGNNVFAYADLVAPDGYSPGDMKVTTTAAGTFDRTFDPLLDSSATVAPAVGTHLFYVLNYMHDYFYEVGWTEVSLNSQKDNFGRGGWAATPSGPRRRTPAAPTTPTPAPRRWLAGTNPDVSVDASIPGNVTHHRSWPAICRPAPPSTTRSTTCHQDLVLVDDGSGSDRHLGLRHHLCQRGMPAGKFALIDRGVCTFAAKSKNAQVNGADGCHHRQQSTGRDGRRALRISGSDPTITIPTVGISQEDGAAMKASLAAGTRSREACRGTVYPRWLH